MIEPIVLIVGLLTMVGNLNNYGINTEKYPHLKDVRVRRSIEKNTQETNDIKPYYLKHKGFTMNYPIEVPKKNGPYDKKSYINKNPAVKRRNSLNKIANPLTREKRKIKIIIGDPFLNNFTRDYTNTRHSKNLSNNYNYSHNSLNSDQGNSNFKETANLNSYSTNNRYNDSSYNGISIGRQFHSNYYGSNNYYYNGNVPNNPFNDNRQQFNVNNGSNQNRYYNNNNSYGSYQNNYNNGSPYQSNGIYKPVNETFNGRLNRLENDLGYTNQNYRNSDLMYFYGKFNVTPNNIYYNGTLNKYNNGINYLQNGNVNNGSFYQLNGIIYNGIYQPNGNNGTQNNPIIGRYFRLPNGTIVYYRFVNRRINSTLNQNTAQKNNFTGITINNGIFNNGIYNKNLLNNTLLNKQANNTLIYYNNGTAINPVNSVNITKINTNDGKYPLYQGNGTQHDSVTPVSVDSGLTTTRVINTAAFIGASGCPKFMIKMFNFCVPEEDVAYD